MQNAQHKDAKCTGQATQETACVMSMQAISLSQPVLDNMLLEKGLLAES